MSARSYLDTDRKLHSALAELQELLGAKGAAVAPTSSLDPPKPVAQAPRLARLAMPDADVEAPTRCPLLTIPPSTVDSGQLSSRGNSARSLRDRVSQQRQVLLEVSPYAPTSWDEYKADAAKTRQELELAQQLRDQQRAERRRQREERRLDVATEAQSEPIHERSPAEVPSSLHRDPRDEGSHDSTHDTSEVVTVKAYNEQETEDAVRQAARDERDARQQADRQEFEARLADAERRQWLRHAAADLTWEEQSCRVSVKDAADESIVSLQRFLASLFPRLEQLQVAERDERATGVIAAFIEQSLLIGQCSVLDRASIARAATMEAWASSFLSFHERYVFETAVLALDEQRSLSLGAVRGEEDEWWHRTQATFRQEILPMIDRLMWRTEVWETNARMAVEAEEEEGVLRCYDGHHRSLPAVRVHVEKVLIAARQWRQHVTELKADLVEREAARRLLVLQEETGVITGIEAHMLDAQQAVAIADEQRRRAAVEAAVRRAATFCSGAMPGADKISYVKVGGTASAASRPQTQPGVVAPSLAAPPRPKALPSLDVANRRGSSGGPRPEEPIRPPQPVRSTSRPKGDSARR